MCDLFGGVSAGQKVVNQQEAGFGDVMNSYFQQQYGQQQATLGQLQALTARIQSGQTGPGFSGAENAANIALIQNQAAAQARNAIQAQRTVGAGSQNAPTGGMTRQSGINQQTAALTEAAAGTWGANQMLAEQAANYGQGRMNAQEAAGLLSQQVGMYNPAGYAQQYQGSLGQQWQQQTQMEQERQAAASAKLGLGLKLGMTAATFGAGGFAALGPGESFGQGLSDFMAGGSNAAFGTDFGISNAPSPSSSPSPSGGNYSQNWGVS